MVGGGVVGVGLAAFSGVRVGVGLGPDVRGNGVDVEAVTAVSKYAYLLVFAY
ncbi:MAG: hypothetical protein IPK17_01535 [Chloroflexi bacterium]|uniref:hypothetical protein n=1 Tax=Candidatus Flexifilum breve TaxID=3140694 RepID=UPI003135C750|nr:hypothetical protein [Chloroflexota bacterium]